MLLQFWFHHQFARSLWKEHYSSPPNTIVWSNSRTSPVIYIRKIFLYVSVFKFPLKSVRHVLYSTINALAILGYLWTCKEFNYSLIVTFISYRLQSINRRLLRVVVMYLVPSLGMMFLAYSCLMNNTKLKTVDLTEVDNCDTIEVFVIFWYCQL